MPHNQPSVEKLAMRADIDVSDLTHDGGEWSVVLYAPVFKRLSAYNTHEARISEASRTLLWETAAGIIEAGIEDCPNSNTCEICQSDVAEHEYDMER